jgi:hypothetical protein
MSNEAVATLGAAASPAPAEGLSQVERVVDTFIAPSKTFKDILRSSSWWLPFLLLAVMQVASTFVIDRQVGFDRVFENTLAQSPKAEDQINQLQPDQKAAAIKGRVVGTKYVTYGFPVFLLIVFGIYALILWGCFNFVFGAQTTFWQAFAVSYYAALPYVLLSLLTIVTLYFGGNAESFLQQNPVGTNLGYYMPDAAPWLKALLTQLDVIRLWSLCLAIMGMAIVAKKSFMQSALVVGGLWLIGVIFAVGGAAMS